MARQPKVTTGTNEEITETTTTTQPHLNQGTTMSKRSFAVPSTALATVIPTLDQGVYAGVISNAAVVGKEDKQHIFIGKEKGKWDKNKWNEEKQKQGDWEYPTDSNGQPVWIIEGTIYFGSILTSKKAVAVLKQDEPRIFGGQIRLNFDRVSLTLDPKNNTTLANLLIATGLNEVDYAERIDFDFDESIEVPAELSGVANAVDMLNALNYHREYFSLICADLNGIPVLANVLKIPKREDKSNFENILNTGSFNSSCGVIKYEEGAENDLDD